MPGGFHLLAVEWCFLVGSRPIIVQLDSPYVVRLSLCCWKGKCYGQRPYTPQTRVGVPLESLFLIPSKEYGQWCFTSNESEFPLFRGSLESLLDQWNIT